MAGVDNHVINFEQIPLFNAGVLGRQFGQSVIFQSRILSTIDAHYFPTGDHMFDNDDAIRAAYAVVSGRLLMETHGVEPSMNLITTGIMAEYGGLMNALPLQQPRDAYVAAARALSVYTHEHNLRWISEAHQTHNTNVAAGGDAVPNANPAGAAARANLTHDEVAELNVSCIVERNDVSRVLLSLPRTFQEAEIFFQHVVHEMEEIALGTITQLSICVGALLGLAKRGTYSDELSGKVIASIRLETGYNIILNRQQISMYYEQACKPYLNPTSAREANARLMQALPAQAQRARIMIEHMANSGLTSFYTIRNAMNDFLTFKWGIVELVRPGELRNYMEASEAIAGDKYYAFRHTPMGAAASRHYTTLFWTARTLYILSGRDNQIIGYGQPGSYKANQFPVIRQAINNYLANEQYVTPEGLPRIAGGFDNPFFAEVSAALVSANDRFNFNNHRLEQPVGNQANAGVEPVLVRLPAAIPNMVRENERQNGADEN